MSAAQVCVLLCKLFLSEAAAMRNLTLPASLCAPVQEATRVREQEEMEAIGQEEGYGRLFPTFRTIEEVRNRRCRCCAWTGSCPRAWREQRSTATVVGRGTQSTPRCCCPLPCFPSPSASPPLLPPLHSSVWQGLRACDAVDSLVDASAIDTLLSNFIVPLQSDDISKPDASGAGREGLGLGWA